MSKTKIAINGYGRIGICVARIIYTRDDVELVAINSSTPHSEIEYLTKYDSVHGNFKEEIKVENGYLVIGKKVKAKILSDRNPKTLDFGEYGAEVVLECTGQFLTEEKAMAHLKNGVKKVILSAPAKDNTPTFVMGVNETLYSGESIISNASCTTNCLGPLTKLIDDTLGIEKAIMTTIHSYTASQNVLDSKNIKDRRKGRSAALNIIPTTTGAAKAMIKIMPHLEGKIHGQAVRVPTPNVSLVDVNYVLKNNTSIKEVNQIIQNASQNKYNNILSVDNEMLVSSDFIGNSNSSIVATDMTQVIDGDLLKIMTWYDNEFGYSSRLIDMAKYINK